MKGLTLVSVKHIPEGRYLVMGRNKMMRLKEQSCKSYSNNYMIASTQINTEIFAFITVLVFTLASLKVLFINRKDNRNC